MPHKRPREAAAPAPPGAPSLFSVLLAQTFDVKRACVIGIPMEWDEEKLKAAIAEAVAKVCP